MKTILAAIDFSPATPAILAQASTLARAMSARIVLMHVTEPVASIVDFAVMTVSVAGVDEQAVRRARDELGRLSQELIAQGLAAESLHAVGTPAREIADQAGTLGADYLVIGSHGHTAFHDLVVGSTAGAVLRRAPCPIMLVPVGAVRRAAAPAPVEAAR